MQGHVDELELVRALNLAVVAADRDGKVTFANDAAGSLYGGPAGDLVGHPLSSFVVETRTPDGGVDALTHVLGGETWRGDLRTRRADGSTFVAAVVASPLRRPDGEVRGLVVFCEDITRKRHTPDDIDTANAKRLALAHEAAQLGTWQWEIASGDVIWD
jgi:PAS domain S-box-containing protein